MILGGTLIKSHYGVQGTLSLMEGSASQDIFLSDTNSIQVSKRTEEGKWVKKEFPLNKQLKLKDLKQNLFPELDVQLVGYAPHTKVQYESWFKGNQVFIEGLKPFSASPDDGKTLPISSKVNIEGSLWDLMAFKTNNADDLAKRASQENLKNTLLFVDEKEASYLYIFDSLGIMKKETFSKTKPSSLAVYNQGLGGYYSFAKIPFKALSKEQKLSAYETYAQAFKIYAPTNSSEVVFESLLRCKCLPASPLDKLEENIPHITLRIKALGQTEFITLPFEPVASGLPWPILKGSYLIRFQPASLQLPYKVRLRQARQINYPHSNQPFSYESDLLITDLKTGEKSEKTLSMNHVHETWDGTRFYLANLSPPEEGKAKKVQIIVNHDPAKYKLTYPGALLVSLGVILLFWMRPYTFRKD